MQKKVWLYCMHVRVRLFDASHQCHGVGHVTGYAVSVPVGIG